jgi:hypothetical protein
VGCKWRNFGYAGTDRIPIHCAPDENLFTVRRTGDIPYNGAVFEVKKEIPDGLSVLFYTRDV